jgi:hypothetical protein
MVHFRVRIKRDCNPDLSMRDMIRTMKVAKWSMLQHRLAVIDHLRASALFTTIKFRNRNRSLH